MSKIEHIAIIMDGNGRWAEGRFRPRIWGHVRGANRISDIVEEANNMGIRALTLFAFSTENWSRPQREILALFSLLRKFLKKEKNRIIRNRIKFKVMGDLMGLPESTRELIIDLEDRTKDMQGLKLNFAFDYGGRSEIINSVNKFIKQNPGSLITEKDLYDNLYISEAGDVDLLIRTGGEYRISNFLLWQIAYAELYFTEIKWPDFNGEDLKKIYHEVSTRERRFGGVQASLDLMSNSREASIRKINMQYKVD